MASHNRWLSDEFLIFAPQRKEADNKQIRGPSVPTKRHRGDDKQANKQTKRNPRRIKSKKKSCTQALEPLSIGAHLRPILSALFLRGRWGAGWGPNPHSPHAKITKNAPKASPIYLTDKSLKASFTQCDSEIGSVFADYRRYCVLHVSSWIQHAASVRRTCLSLRLLWSHSCK